MAADFISVADKVAREIAGGRLRPGDRLLPQRVFAHRHGIAVSTASRVYSELARRGLVAGEVGRGTYVRAAPLPAYPPLVEPAAAPVDLELIFPMLPEHEGTLARALARLAGSPACAQALRPIGAAATQPAREAAAAFLARRGWKPDPAGVLFAGNGRQAIAAALAALAKPGDRIGVEVMTYPAVKGIGRAIAVDMGVERGGGHAEAPGHAGGVCLGVGHGGHRHSECRPVHLAEPASCGPGRGRPPSPHWCVRRSTRA